MPCPRSEPLAHTATEAKARIGSLKANPCRRICIQVIFAAVSKQQQQESGTRTGMAIGQGGWGAVAPEEEGTAGFTPQGLAPCKFLVHTPSMHSLKVGSRSVSPTLAKARVQAGRGKGAVQPTALSCQCPALQSESPIFIYLFILNCKVTERLID